MLLQSSAVETGSGCLPEAAMKLFFSFLVLDEEEEEDDFFFFFFSYLQSTT